MASSKAKNENHTTIDFNDEHAVYKALNAIGDDTKYHELTYTADEYLIYKTHSLWDGENFKISIDRNARKYFVKPIEPTAGEIEITYSYTENLFFDRHNQLVLVPPSEARLSRKRFISNFQKEWNRHAEAEELEGLNLGERMALHLLQMEYVVRARVDPDKVVISVALNNNLTLFQAYEISFTENICKTPGNNIVLLPKKISKKKKQQLLVDVDLKLKGARSWMGIVTEYVDLNARSFPCAVGRCVFVNFRSTSAYSGDKVGLDPRHNKRLLVQHYPGFAEKSLQEMRKIESHDQLLTE